MNKILFFILVLVSVASGATIKSPKATDKLTVNDTIVFEAIVEDSRIKDRDIIWEADDIGVIGYGRKFSRKLPAGNYFIFLKVFNGEVSRDILLISVKDPSKEDGSGGKEKPVVPKRKVKPKVVLTYVPKIGSSKNLRGLVEGIPVNDYVVLVLIRVEGRWWPKPFYDEPLTGINSDGTWECDITTGGVDEIADSVAVFIVPKGKASFEKRMDNAIANVRVQRSVNASTLNFTPMKLKGICYGASRDNENPDLGILPTVEEISADLPLIKAVSDKVRIYSCRTPYNQLPKLCEENGLSCIIGAWLGKYPVQNNAEIDSLIKISEENNISVKALVVGNEVLLRKDLTSQELIEYIRKVKKATKLPVTTAEISSHWFEHPEVADEVDFMIVHIYPFWNGKSIDIALASLLEEYRLLKKRFPDKRIVLGETGWPTDGKSVGKAVPSNLNQMKYLKDFVVLANENDIEYYYFSMFDENWKKKFEGELGAHWGIFNSDGSIKEHNKGILPSDSHEGINRPAREVEAKRVGPPLVVYRDATSKENGFQPSGWMGDLDFAKLDNNCKHNPYSGDSCIKITYSPKVFFTKGWTGIYWQYPLNNWGDYPGYDLRGASKLTFYVRGDKGGERSEFKIGGISSGFKYKDSFGPLSTGVVKLTDEWQKITLKIRGDTSTLIGGFCWVTNRYQNPGGCTIYLDEIVIE